MKRSPTTGKAYLASLPADRRRAISKVRRVIRKNLRPGFRELVQHGAISYVVPLSRYPVTYNGQPLLYLALANQKHFMAIYLCAVYADREERARFVRETRAAGARLSMGKSCVRFRSLDDLPLPVVGRAVKRFSVAKFIALHERGRKRRRC